MKIYTRRGDKGKTSLINEIEVSKADERIELLGTIDELSTAIGFAKVIMEDSVKKDLSSIQKELMFIMAGIADVDNPMYQVDEDEIHALEVKIDEIEDKFEREQKLVLYGDCEKSARLDLARVAARKAERYFWKIQKKYNLDILATRYMNRLSDYFYILARFEDYKKN